MSAESGPDPTALARLALDLHRQPDTTAVLERVVRAAVDEVPGARFAGVTVIDREGARTPAASAPVVTAVDSLQYAMNEGPCLAATQETGVIVSADLVVDARWPTFGPRAREHGVRSMMAVQILAEHGLVAALNLYAPGPDAFGAASEAAAVPLAIHAGTALASVRAEANLRTALASRDLIGQAKGILMERNKISADVAFELLTRVSQRRHRKLRDVAEQLADTGELAGPVPHPVLRRPGTPDGAAPGPGIGDETR